MIEWCGCECLNEEDRWLSARHAFRIPAAFIVIIYYVYLPRLTVKGIPDEQRPWSSSVQHRNNVLLPYSQCRPEKLKNKLSQSFLRGTYSKYYTPYKVSLGVLS